MVTLLELSTGEEGGQARMDSNEMHSLPQDVRDTFRRLQSFGTSAGWSVESYVNSLFPRSRTSNRTFSLAQTRGSTVNVCAATSLSAYQLFVKRHMLDVEMNLWEAGGLARLLFCASKVSEVAGYFTSSTQMHCLHRLRGGNLSATVWRTLSLRPPMGWSLQRRCYTLPLLFVMEDLSARGLDFRDSMASSLQKWYGVCHVLGRLRQYHIEF